MRCIGRARRAKRDLDRAQTSLTASDARGQTTLSQEPVKDAQHHMWWTLSTSRAQHVLQASSQILLGIIVWIVTLGHIQALVTNVGTALHLT
eukprot:COSAG01_NODE_6395_length_3693_cov_2.142181_3_plen_92_part_00